MSAVFSGRSQGSPRPTRGPGWLVVAIVVSLAGCAHGRPPHAEGTAAPGPGRPLPRLASARVGDYRCPEAPSPMGYVVWRTGRAHLRRHWTETDLRRVVTSKRQPVEVCGVVGQIRWLLAATCPDGSHPFHDPVQAHNARVGSVGRGGRCGTSIIDLYRVPCPGKVFFVYMDLYACEEGRSPFDGPRAGGGR